MKRYEIRVLAVLLVLFLVGATAHAQAVTPGPPTVQSLQQELQRMQEMMRELERQINLQQRATQGQGQRGGGGRGGAPANPPNQANVSPNNPDNLNVVTADGRVGRALSLQPLSLQGAAWWTNTALLTRLGLTDDQKLKIERVYESHRQNLVSSKDTLEKEEAQLAKLLEADPLDRTSSTAQIYKVVQARGEMEKTNSLMTFEMREVLTRAQWTQLQAQQPLGINLGYTIRTEGAVGTRGGGQRSGRGQ